MGRSKKTWDHLVDHRGNYGIDIKSGIFPGADGRPIKGNAGLKGSTGEKGDQGIKGKDGRYGPPGQIGIGVKGDKGDTGQDLIYNNLTPLEKEQIKGGKGEIGDKGDVGASPLLEFEGSVADPSALPGGATDGDTYYVESENQYYSWNGTSYDAIGTPSKGAKGETGTGQKGDRGQQGEKGEEGPSSADGTNGSSGAKGEPGQSAYSTAVSEGFPGNESEWVDSLKGNKGEDGATAGGDAFDESEYYSQGQIDTLIEGHNTPEAAFHYLKSKYSPDNVITGQINYKASDRFLHQYDEGCVLVNAAPLSNGAAPPFSTNSVILINYVLNDPLGSRSTQYEILQFAYAREGANAYEGYVRRAHPSSNSFSDWKPCSFDDALYYTKKEVDRLIDEAKASESDYVLLSNAGAESSTAKLVLRDRTINGSPDTEVVFRGTSGIRVNKVKGEIEIDGSAFNPTTFIGTLTPGQNPSIVAGDPDKGDFFIYDTAGEAWNSEQVVAGDFLLYSGSALNIWTHVFVGGENGVLTVDVDGGLLLKEGTEKRPIIALNDDVVVTHDQLAPQLDKKVGWAQMVEFARNRTLGSLSDVEAGESTVGAGGSYQTYVDVLPVTPMTAGQYSTSIVSQELRLAQNDKLVRSIQDLYNGTVVDTTLHRIIATDLSFDFIDKVIEKSFDGKDYVFKYEDPNVVATLENSNIPFNVNMLIEYDTDNGAVLRYNSALKKWLPAESTIGITEAEADAKYMPSGGSVHIAGTLEVDSTVRAKADASLEGVTTAKKIVVEELEITNALAGNDNAVTHVQLNDILTGYVPSAAAAGFFERSGGTLLGDLQLESSDTFSTIRISGHPSKQFKLELETSEGVVSVLSASTNNVNLNGLRVLNVGNPERPFDAVNLRTADRRYARAGELDYLKRVAIDLQNQIDELRG